MPCIPAGLECPRLPLGVQGMCNTAVVVVGRQPHQGQALWLSGGHLLSWPGRCWGPAWGGGLISFQGKAAGTDARGAGL